MDVEAGRNWLSLNGIPHQSVGHVLDLGTALTKFGLPSDSTFPKHPAA